MLSGMQRRKKIKTKLHNSSRKLQFRFGMLGATLYSWVSEYSDTIEEYSDTIEVSG